MAIWFFAPLLAMGVALALLVLYRARRRKKQRLQLRLLAGKSHLLSAEIAHCLEELERLDQEGADEARAAAEEALDQFHVLLVERQAHLQNCEDLVHLQQRKLAYLGEEAPRAAAAPARRPATASPPSPAQRRTQLEDQLLRQIEELNKQRNPPPPRQ